MLLSSCFLDIFIINRNLFYQMFLLQLLKWSYSFYFSFLVWWLLLNVEQSSTPGIKNELAMVYHPSYIYYYLQVANDLLRTFTLMVKGEIFSVILFFILMSLSHFDATIMLRCNMSLSFFYFLKEFMEDWYYLFLIYIWAWTFLCGKLLFTNTN